MDMIDKGINSFYVVTKSSTNIYKVTTGLNKTILANRYSIKVAIPCNSNGIASITVDSVIQVGTFARVIGSEVTVILGYRPKMVICMLADNNQEFYFDLMEGLCSFIQTRVRLIAKSDGFYPCKPDILEKTYEMVK